MDNVETLVKEAIAGGPMFSRDLYEGGYLNPEQSEKFIRGVLDQPTLLKACRQIIIKGENKKIEKIGFGSRIMRPAEENTALRSDDYAKPDFGKVELSTKEVIAEVRISYDTLENNIETAGIKNTIMALIQQRVALDLEELMIQGDTDSSDPYLATVDGILKKADRHVVDAAGKPISTNLFAKLIKSVPPKYRRLVPEWRIYTDYDVDMAWKESIATRNTVAGDRFLLQNANAIALGYEIQPCAMFPVPGFDPEMPPIPPEAWGDFGIGHKALLIHPKNMIAGFTRRVQVETDKDISARQIIIVVTLKVDFALEEADAVGKIINLGPDYEKTTGVNIENMSVDNVGISTGAVNVDTQVVNITAPDGGDGGGVG